MDSPESLKSPSAPESPLDALEREACRVYARYQREIVEALKVCPWAERARLDGNVDVAVVLASEDELRADLSMALAALDRHAANDATQIGLIVFPRITWTRHEFERWLGELRATEQKRHRDRGDRAPFALAAFHHDAAPPAAGASPYQWVPYLRRTPDPTIQCVRIDVLEELRGAEEGKHFVDPDTIQDIASFLDAPLKKPLHERVAQANATMLERVGVADFGAIIEDIKADRDAAYAPILRALGEAGS